MSGAFPPPLDTLAILSRNIQRDLPISRILGEAVVTTRIESLIYIIREERVMLDQDLAELYQVETKALVQAVQRNAKRFPQDFMFQLSFQECPALRSQIVTSKDRGGRRTAPYAFTEHGVAMLSSVLRSDRAVEINIEHLLRESVIPGYGKPLSNTGGITSLKKINTIMQQTKETDGARYQTRNLSL